jgi:hypothetical protein
MNIRDKTPQKTKTVAELTVSDSSRRGVREGDPFMEAGKVLSCGEPTRIELTEESGIMDRLNIHQVKDLFACFRTK